MNFQSKRTVLAILGITSLVFSRLMFSFFNDPEGTNLLVTVGMAAILYTLSLPVYLLNSKISGQKRVLLTVLAQLGITICFYLFLR